MNLTKTKKIITFGPSMDRYFQWGKDFFVDNNVQDKFNTIVEAGVDCIRFNMSHDSIDNHEKRFNAIKELNKNSPKKVSVLIDTKGPEIRVCRIDDKDNIIYINDQVIIKTNEPDFIGNNREFAVTDSTRTYHLELDLKIGDCIYVADGKLVLEVLKIDSENHLIYTISKTEKFQITSNRRINLIEKNYHLPFLSDYDRETIKKAVEWKVDFIALSFLSNIHQLQQVKDFIKHCDSASNIKLIAKIENRESLNNLNEIIEKTDGIMVARGDLALEIGFEKVPFYEDLIVHNCLNNNKISIVATQVLDSLENSLIPTRAETYDCYNIVKLGANAVMLSGETASGIDPLNSVIKMNKIIEFAESVDFQNLKTITPFVHVVTDVDDIVKFSWEIDDKIGKFYNFSESDLWMTLLKKVYFLE